MRKTLATLSQAVGLFGLLFEISRAIVSIVGLLSWDQFCGVLAVVITACYGIARLHAYFAHGA